MSTIEQNKSLTSSDGSGSLKANEPRPVEPHSDVAATVQTGVHGSTAKPIAIDELSKWIAVGLVFVYVSGFLITSLNDFRFGFMQMNPVRPRILAAGGWFAIFLAVPVAVVSQWRQSGLWSQKISRWHKGAQLLYAYFVIISFITLYCGFIFEFDEVKSTHFTFISWLKIAVLLVAGAVIAAGNIYSRLPRWLVAASIFSFYGWITYEAVRDLFERHLFLPSASTLWLLIVGTALFFEMRARGWRPVLGDWHRSLVGFLFVMGTFATTYYPHIKSQWGGGYPIPIAMTLSKDAPVHAGQTVFCSLVDETDSGFYVVGKNDKHATFIPRNEVSLVHFADTKEQSMFTSP